MKGWTDRQIFFVFDTEFCQNEEDDPKDAIVYFRPQETSESVRCTLCCQLMGISRFLKYGFSPVSLIRLEKGKFAIRTIGKYHLALKGNPDMPDSILQRQMDRLVDLFTFYFKDFDSIQTECLGSRQAFLEKMNSVWNVLVPISQHGGNTLNLTFSLVPSIDLPKTAGILHLQAAQLLQACQWHDAVLVGCIMCNNSVLHSQLPASVLHNLSFTLSNNMALPGEVASVKFDIPGGIALTYVYLTQKELTELSASNGNTAVASKETLRRTRTNCKSQKKCETTNVSEEAIVHSAEPMNQECILTKANDEITVDDPHSKQPSPSLSINKKDMTSSDESFAENFEELKTTPEPVSLDVVVVAEMVTNICVDDTSSSLSEEIVVQVPLRDDAFDAESSEFRTVDSSESESIGGTSLELCRVVLYVQRCNDSTLVLLMDDGVTDEADVVHALWQLGLTSLTVLEKDIKNCLEMRPSKGTKDMSRYHYLQYEKKWQSAKGNLHSPERNVASHHSFSRNVQLVHEEFRANPNLHEMTLRAKENVIYGHQMGSKETFYQPHCHRGGKSISSASNDSCRGMPFPHQNDPVATVSSTSRHRLEIDHKLVLL